MPRNREDDSLVARILKIKPPMFWWILVNTLALCMAIMSWVFFLEVFGNPHHPRNYALLEKMGRPLKVKDFTPLMHPPGTVNNPAILYKKYYNLNQADTRLLNSELLKNYVTNFKDTSLNTYVKGQFKVLQTRPLQANDLITDGIAIQLQSMVQPDEFHPPTPYLVILELFLPSTSTATQEAFQPGQLIELNKSPHFFSVLYCRRIERAGDEPLISLTAVPLAYQSTVKASAGTGYTITPPERLNLKGSFPLFHSH